MEVCVHLKFLKKLKDFLSYQLGTAGTGEDLKKEEHASTAGGNASWYTLSRNQFGGSSENWT